MKLQPKFDLHDNGILYDLGECLQSDVCKHTNWLQVGPMTAEFLHSRRFSSFWELWKKR